MQRHNQERQEAEEITATDEILAKQYEIGLLHEQIEFSHELIETLNLELRYKEQQIEQLEQELTDTNRDLSDVLMSQKLEYDQAKQLAQKILNTNKSASESLAELFTAIYGCATPPDELEHLDSGSIITNSSISAETDQMVARLQEVKARSKQLYSQYKDLQFQFAYLKNKFLKISKISNNLRTEPGEKERIINKRSDSNHLNCSPPPIFSNYSNQQLKQQHKNEVMHNRPLARIFA